MESDIVLAALDPSEEKPLSMRESGLNQGESTDWRRWESNPHLRIANAPTKVTKPLINQHETHGANEPMARNGALSAQKDARLGALIDAWDTLPEAIKAGIAAMVKSVG
ncbi:MAG: hypothetical protein ACP5I8_00665 [Phycisphaerae bacterium]